MDYNKMISDIIANIGGKENIDSVAHCMTRLRFTLKDKNLANYDALKKIDGVVGALYGVGQCQVILGKHLMPAFSTLTQNYDFTVGEEINENLDESLSPGGLSKKKWNPKEIGRGVIEYIVGSVTPIVPGLIAGGMLRVLLMLVTMAVPSVADSQTYNLFNMLSNIPFYFLPVFVAYGASKKLACTPTYPLIIICALFYPNFVALLGTGETVSILGLPVLAIGYSSSLIPALLGTFAVAKLEKLFDKIVPNVLKPVLVGTLTLATSYVLVLVVLGPIGIYIGNYVVAALVWIHGTIGPMGNALLTALLPYMIMTGMHTLLGPIMVQTLATSGYDSLLRPAALLHNMAEGGACFGVALRTKNKKLCAEAISAGVGAIFGVSEPAIFGVTMRLKKPLIAVSIGGGVAGFVAGLLGAHNYTMGYSSILALPIFEDTIVAISIGVVIAIVGTAVMAFILGFDDPNESNIERKI